MLTPRSLILMFVPLAPLLLFAQEAPDREFCGIAFSQGIKNSSHIVSGQQRYESFQARFCAARFESYGRMSSSAGSLGFSIPLAEGLLGIDAAARADDQRFQEKRDAFCKSSYLTSSASAYFENHEDEVSAALMSSSGVSTSFR